MRDGTTNWDIFYDVGNPAHYVETFIATSWTEQLRCQVLFTKTDKEIVDRLLIFHIGEAALTVNHFIYAFIATEK